MACGTPVIGSEIAGLQSYIKNQYNGFLFEPKNINKLVITIKKYYDLDTNTINLLRKNSYQTSQKFEKQNIKGVLVDIFHGV